MIEIEAPDGSIVEFPDGTPDEVMSQAMRRAFAQNQPDFQSQAAALDPTDLSIARSKNDALGEFLRDQALAPVEGESEEQRQRRLFGSISDREIGTGQGVARAALQGATFGAGDEIVAGGAAALAPLTGSNIPGETIGQRYNAFLETERGRLDQFREESPVTATVAEIGGALPTAFIPMGALGRAAQGGSLLARTGAGAAIGAGQGAVYGFNTGEGTEDRIENAGTGGLIGGTLGAAAPAIGAGVQRIANMVPNSRAAQATIAGAPSVDDLAARSRALFQQADGLGVVVKPDAYRSFADDLATVVAKEGIDAQVTPATSGVLARVLAEADSGKPLSLQAINTVRRVAQNAAGSPDPNERRIASLMIDKMDDFVDNLTPANLDGGQPGVAGPILKEARSLWGKLRRTNMVDDAVVRAERRAASTGSGGNVNNAIRQNIRSILDSPTKSRGFSPVELQAMEDVVRGTPTQNALRLAGKLSPQGNGLSLILNLGAAGASGGATIPLTAAGMGAKMLADKGTQGSTALARALIARGGDAVQPQLGTQSGRLAQLLAQRNAAITGPAR